MTTTTNVVRDGVIFRTSAETTTKIFGDESEGILWQLKTSSWFNTETGEQKFQIIHYLKMNILASDIIEFEISMRPLSNPKGVS